MPSPYLDDDAVYNHHGRGSATFMTIRLLVPQQVAFHER